MDFSFDHISIFNLFENGHNYIIFSIMGMLIVFAGLSFISIYIALLPKILALPQKLMTGKEEKKVVPEIKSVDAKDSELLLAIAVALHLEQESSSRFEKITWKRYEVRESAWLTAGRIGNLAVRSHLPDNRS